MTLPRDWFQKWLDSPYYHLLHSETKKSEAGAFIRKLLNHLKPAAGSLLLHIGAGHGGNSKLFASFGFDVTGIDLSAASIAIAQRSQTENLHFFQHDIRLPFWINYFDYAFLLFDGFGYFRTEREHTNAVRTIANALKPNGIFVLDYVNVNYAGNHLSRNLKTEVNGTVFVVDQSIDETHLYNNIHIQEKGSSGPTFTEAVAKLSLGDLNEMFSYNKLQIQEVFGDYDMNAFDVKNSRRMIIIAKKLGLTPNPLSASQRLDSPLTPSLLRKG